MLEVETLNEFPRLRHTFILILRAPIYHGSGNFGEFAMMVRCCIQLNVLLGAFVTSAGLTFLPMVAAAAEIEIPLDQVKVVTFKIPVKTVFVGNPVIADITVIDSTHVFVLGKSFGSTNLIALDHENQEVLNEQVVVLERLGSAVTLQRGTAKTTLNCSTTRCEVVPTPGDDKGTFEDVNGQIDRRQTLSLKSAGAQ